MSHTVSVSEVLNRKSQECPCLGRFHGILRLIPSVVSILCTYESVLKGYVSGIH